jgi:hypothetical protein
MMSACALVLRRIAQRVLDCRLNRIAVSDLELNPLARADAHQIPPTHFRFNDFRYVDLRRRSPVSDSVAPGFRGYVTQF